MRALITGITGQDGTYLAELLLAKGYSIAGTSRDVAEAREGLAGLSERVDLIPASLANTAELRRIVASVQPDEVYNLAGQSRVGVSWTDPEGTADVNAVGATRLLEAVRLEAPRARVFQATSCEIFEPTEQPANERSALGPTSPYGIAKLHAHLTVRAFRERYGMFAVSGILFNHESPRRGEDFVTGKIARAAMRIARGEQRELRLGNTAVRRDWGFAGDYVEAMWKMLQHGVAEDFVIGTGVAHSVQEFCHQAFRAVGLDARDFVVSDPGLVRAGDAPVRVADASRARAVLGWTPRVSFPELIRMMVHADIDALRR